MLFYYTNGDYFYNAIALQDNSYYLWKTSYGVRRELPLYNQEDMVGTNQSGLGGCLENSSGG